MDPATADVSVRVAWADDAAAIAEVQAPAWREQYADLLPAETLTALDDTGSVAAGWQAALSSPGDARNRVLVALERARVVGFAVTGPTADPDCDPIAHGELSDLTVLPGHQRLGHGSRLLQAAADTLRADRFAWAVAWLASTDDARRDFLTSAGWAADGAHRELDLDGTGAVRVRQVRLHTALA